jgi:hypothetical protein
MVTQTVDNNGAELYLDGAHLSMPPGVFRFPTQVTIEIIPSIEHAGAYGPVFQISLPAPSLIRQVPTLTLSVPSIGANQPSVVLGVLDPSLPRDAQQWTPAQNSVLSADQQSVSGLVTAFGNASLVYYAVVVGCPPVTTCPSGQSCNSGTCQQCPTSSPCP